MSVQTASRHFYSASSGGATLSPGRAGQTTWLEDPPPWLRPAYCFASVIALTEHKNVTISDRSMYFFISIRRPWRPVFPYVLRATKRWSTFLKKNCIRWTGLGFSDLEMTRSMAPLMHWRLYLMTCLTTSDLEMTWLPWRPGAATVRIVYRRDQEPLNLFVDYYWCRSIFLYISLFLCLCLPDWRINKYKMCS